jgi:hypothetical protein
MITKLAFRGFAAFIPQSQQGSALVLALISCVEPQSGFVAQCIRYSNEVPARDLLGDTGAGTAAIHPELLAELRNGMDGLPITGA